MKNREHTYTTNWGTPLRSFFILVEHMSNFDLSTNDRTSACF
jgi:hypothetical protein